MSFRASSRLAACLLLQVTAAVFGQSKDNPQESSPIQDNSFLVEEAYNQERGVVQHISTFSRLWNCRDWSYTFTQEFPGRRNPRHQFSYTLMGMHSGEFAGTGWGDMAFHYRYQLIGDGDSRVAVSPRLSLLLPTGDVTAGRGTGSAGIQTNLPVSVALHRRLVTHWNAGATYLPHTQDDDHCHASSLGYNLGQSFVFLVHPRFNFLLETAHTRFQSVIAPGRTEWAGATYVSPGVRWAYNFKSGLQIVPGVAVPVGVAGSAGERGIFLYLSFEHPFHRLYGD